MLQCPICDVNLLTTDRHGVEIDYCPHCRGVWLDRGELDKIIKQATETARERYATQRAWPKLNSQPGIQAVGDV